MQVSGSGPLGVLLMIAPLAAIPVFAILGVPQFAPVVASGTEDDDFAELGETSSRPPAVAAPAPTPTRSANDLFAPVAEPPPRPQAASAATDQRPRPALLTSDSGRSRGSKRWLPPSDALDQWEVRTDISDSVAAPRMQQPADSPPETSDDGFEGLEGAGDEVDDGQVSAEGFNPDLLKADRAIPSKKRTRSADDAPLELPADRRSGVKTDGKTAPAQRTESGRGTGAAAEFAENAGALAQSADEQSGWQDAARRLKKLGIRKYRLESRIDEQNFVFMCTFASPDNPRVVRRFEAEADNPLEAVQRVLEQIDEWRNREGTVSQAASLPDDEN
jgi:hypothetical protein